jgi:hypothetical protein
MAHGFKRIRHGLKKLCICLGSRSRLDKSNRPSRSIPKITEIDTRWIGCGSLLGRLDLSDRRGLNSYEIVIIKQSPNTTSLSIPQTL